MNPDPVAAGGWGARISGWSSLPPVRWRWDPVFPALLNPCLLALASHTHGTRLSTGSSQRTAPTPCGEGSPPPSPGCDSRHGPLHRDTVLASKSSGIWRNRSTLFLSPSPGHGFPPAIPTHCPLPAGAGEELRMRGRGGGCSPLPASRHPQGRWPPRSTAGDKPAPAPPSSGQGKTGTGVQQSRFPTRYSGPGRFTGCVNTRRVCSL